MDGNDVFPQTNPENRCHLMTATPIQHATPMGFHVPQPSDQKLCESSTRIILDTGKAFKVETLQSCFFPALFLSTKHSNQQSGTQEWDNLFNLWMDNEIRTPCKPLRNPCCIKFLSSSALQIFSHNYNVNKNGVRTGHAFKCPTTSRRKTDISFPACSRLTVARIVQKDLSGMFKDTSPQRTVGQFEIKKDARFPDERSPDSLIHISLVSEGQKH